MLAEFITSNNASIIARARARVAGRAFPKPSDNELVNGIPLFVEQLVVALRLALTSDVPAHQQISKTAARHGRALFDMGLTIAQVVHDYGDVCQTITELAVQQNAAISAADFQTLNLCLDDAIAEAVTEFAQQREHAQADRGTERLGMLAHELRNQLNTALLSFESITSGRVAPGGSTALIHGRSLMALRDLIEGSLTTVRLDAGIQNVEAISVAKFIEEVEIAALMHARACGAHFGIRGVDPTVMVAGDRPLLATVISNFLQNAFKFTKKGGCVTLSARVTTDRVFLDVEDECGGLPPGKAEELFRPFQQRSSDRGGLGLGLTICQRAAAANSGEILVRNLPGKGCVFTLALPRQAAPVDVSRTSRTEVSPLDPLVHRNE
jgi:signal transduction histidine kinase